MEPAPYSPAELSRLLGIAHARGAHTVVLGHGQSAPAHAAAVDFVQAWTVSGGQILDVVTWPEQAASWLRQANRFTAREPDLWVMAGGPVGWAQMTRLLLWSTAWTPSKTLTLGGHISAAAVVLVENKTSTDSPAQPPPAPGVSATPG
jgi:hypothetical protein